MVGMVGRKVSLASRRRIRQTVGRRGWRCCLAAALLAGGLVAAPETPPEPEEGAAAEAEQPAVEDAPTAEAVSAEPTDETEDGPAEVFVPSEDISEDNSVPFPVDI